MTEHDYSKERKALNDFQRATSQVSASALNDDDFCEWDSLTLQAHSLVASRDEVTTEEIVSELESLTRRMERLRRSGETD